MDEKVDLGIKAGNYILGLSPENFNRFILIVMVLILGYLLYRASKNSQKNLEERVRKIEESRIIEQTEKEDCLKKLEGLNNDWRVSLKEVSSLTVELKNCLKRIKDV